MAPILKSVTASLSSFHRYWSKTQHLDVIKVIVQINTIKVHVGENMNMRSSGVNDIAFVYKPHLLALTHNVHAFSFVYFDRIICI
jgi:hypothetical protein